MLTDQKLRKTESPYSGIHKSEYHSPNWQYVYGAMVAMLVKEFMEKGWGIPGLVDMEGIVSKASAIATLESTAWLTTEHATL